MLPKISAKNKEGHEHLGSRHVDYSNFFIDLHVYKICHAYGSLSLSLGRLFKLMYICRSQQNNVIHYLRLTVSELVCFLETI